MKINFSKTVKTAVSTNAVKVVAYTTALYFEDSQGRRTELTTDKDYHSPTRIIFKDGNIILDGEFTVKNLK